MREVMAPTGHLDQLPKRGHRGRAGIPPASDGIGEAGRVEVDISRSRGGCRDPTSNSASPSRWSGGCATSKRRTRGWPQDLTSQARARRPRAGRRSGWWRALLYAVCIVLAAVLLPVSIVAAWTRAQLVDEGQFVATLAPLAHDPQVQGLVIDQTVCPIDDKVNYDQITGDVIDGIAGLRLPPRALSALGLLKQPAADGLAISSMEGSRSSFDPTRSSMSGRALSGTSTAR